MVVPPPPPLAPSSVANVKQFINVSPIYIVLAQGRAVIVVGAEL